MIEPGIHTIPSDTYHSDPGREPSLSASVAHLLVNTTPLHAWNAHPRLNPNFEREEKAQFDMGSVTHALILEADTSKVQVVYADDWRTKDARAARDQARADGLIPMLQKDWVRVEMMAEAVRAQIARRDDEPPLFDAGKPEQTLVWNERGVTCRARLDWLRDDHVAIDDLKTTGRSANPMQWSRNTLWSIGADIQVAFYLRGLKRLTGVDAVFRYVLVENVPPYGVSVVSMAGSALEIGNAKVDRALERWKWCLDNDEWPGYPSPVYYAETPGYEELRWMEADAEAMTA